MNKFKRDIFIPVAKPNIGKEELANVIRAVKSGWISKGEYINKFEVDFAKYIGTRYAVSATSGTTALHLVLVALGIKKGDEVIVPDLTFVATANAVSYTGAKPVFVDVDENNWCIDPLKIEKAVTRKTKAIIPVHLYGHSADMDPIMKIAKKHNLYVIEDAAEAHGGEYRGRKVGSIGDAAIFSFFGNKIITTGEGGMVITNNKNIAERTMFLRDHARDDKKKYWHKEIGYNYPMTNIQAAIGFAQLKKINKFIAAKRRIFRWYSRHLKNLKGVKLNPEEKWAKNVFWMASLVLGEGARISRDNLIKRLAKRGIDSRPFFYPLSQLPMYGGKPRNPIALQISKSGINLPSGTDLKEKEVKYICDTLKTILSGKSK